MIGANGLSSSAPLLQRAQNQDQQPAALIAWTVAALLVTLLHAMHAPALPGGGLGVDLLIVIAGYGVGRHLLCQMHAGQHTTRDWLSRLLRVALPPAALMVLACLPAAWLWLTPGQLKEYGQAAAAAALLLSNHYFDYRTGPAGQAADLSPLFHTWLLALLAQCGLALAIFCRVLGSARTATLVAGLVALTALSFGVDLVWGARHTTSGYFLLPTRGWEFMAGSLVAVGRAWWTAEGQRVSTLSASATLGGLGLLAVAAGFALASVETGLPGLAARGLVVAGSALVLCAAALVDDGAGRMQGALPARAWAVCFGLFLWHQPVLAFSRALGHRSDTLAVGAVCLLLLGSTAWAASSLLRWLVPRTGRWRSRPLRSAAVLAACLLGGGAWVHAAQGFPERFAAKLGDIAASTAGSPRRADCHVEDLRPRPPEAACVLGVGAPTWAVVGDGHGVEFALALSERLQPQRQALRALTYSGCQPALSFDSNVPGCTAWTRAVLRHLEHDARLTHVVLVFRHSYHLHGDQTKPYPAQSGDRPAFLPDRTPSQARDIYWQSVGEITQRLVLAGKQVWWVDPIPELPASIDRLIYHRDALGRVQPVAEGITPAFYAQRNRDILRMLAQVAEQPGVHRVPAAVPFCATGHCLGLIGREAMYFDSNHPSMAGARRLAALIVPPTNLPADAPVKRP